MDFREAIGKRLQWIDTGIEEARFSNFLFIDQFYASNPVLRRVFSLARKHEFRSLLIEEITEGEGDLLAHENSALALRCPDFNHSEVHRISFFRSPAGQEPAPHLVLTLTVDEVVLGRPADRRNY